ncbi:MAG: PBSX family phage terminase large subunit [Candidatus Merdivicinus sp.]|jgi:phage terminase large subunit
MDKLALSSLIAPPFFDLHRRLRDHSVTHCWLAGGRGSGKSSAVSIEILLGIMRDPNANAVALRKVGATIRDSILEQFLWAANILNVRDSWEVRVSPPVLVYRPTGQRIFLRGTDDPRKMKSLRPEKGYIRYIWFEEADEFAGPAEIRSINQTLMRGGDSFAVFYTFNPPRNRNHWINREIQRAELRTDSLVHHSDYRGVPPEWLGEVFLAEAEQLKSDQPEVYAHEYLGEAVGTGGEVFPNVLLRTIPPEECDTFCRIRRGIDWGYGADPFVYLAAEFRPAQRELLLYHEFFRYRAPYDEIAAHIREQNPSRDPVCADSAEPRSNDELKSRGIRILPAKKGPGSISHGIGWLQNLRKIIIDPERCPNAAREFTAYTLIPDGNGGFLSGFPDRDNHCIDALRYACERELKKTGVSF